MYTTHLSRKEFDSISVTILEEEVMKGNRTGNYRSGRRAINNEREAVSHFSMANTVTHRLEQFNENDILKLQKNLAKFAPRFIFSAYERTFDSLDTFLRRLYADACV